MTGKRYFDEAQDREAAAQLGLDPERFSLVLIAHGIDFETRELSEIEGDFDDTHGDIETVLAAVRKARVSLMLPDSVMIVGMSDGERREYGAINRYRMMACAPQAARCVAKGTPAAGARWRHDAKGHEANILHLIEPETRTDHAQVIYRDDTGKVVARPLIVFQREYSPVAE